MIHESKFHAFKENEGEIYFTESDIENCEDLETLKKWKEELKGVIITMESFDTLLGENKSFKIKKYHTYKLFRQLKKKIKKGNFEKHKEMENNFHRHIMRYCKQNMTESEYMAMIEWAKNEVEYQKIS